MIDIHSHILPGVDDGSQSIEESLEMARMACADGVEIIIATPHVIHGVYGLGRQEILKRVEMLNDILEKNKISIEVMSGGEYFLELELLDLVEKGEVVTLNDKGKHILVEFPAFDVPAVCKGILYDLTVCGLVPVIAHPERNMALADDPKLVYDFLEQGALLQVTAASICGKFGKDAASAAQYFLERGWVHFVASDAHSATVRKPLLSCAKEFLDKPGESGRSQKLLKDNPQLIINGNTITKGNYLLPQKAKNPGSFFSRLFAS